MTSKRRLATWSMAALLSGCGPTVVLEVESDGATGDGADEAGVSASGEDGADETAGSGESPPLDECGLPVTPEGPSCDDAPVELTALYREDGQNAVLAVDDESVFLVTNVGSIDNQVLRVDKCGGEPVPLADAGLNPGQVALSPSQVVWTDYIGDGAVHAVPKAGGDRITLAEADNPLAVAVVDDEVLYGSARVHRVPLTGGPSSVLLDAAGVYLVPRGRDVFVSGVTRVGRVSLDTGAWQTIYDDVSAGAMAVGCDALWWSNEFGSLVRAPIDGGGSTEVVAPAAYRLARDDDYVYATDGVDGEIWAVPVSGGAAVLLADGLDGPFHIAVDRTHLYWTTTSDSSLWAMRNPLR